LAASALCLLFAAKGNGNDGSEFVFLIGTDAFIRFSTSSSKKKYKNSTEKLEKRIKCKSYVNLGRR
jgi:hypothetical protein